MKRIIKRQRKMRIKKEIVSDNSIKKDEETLMTKKLPNHIEEYFTDKEASKEVQASKELFKGEKDNIDLKTDIGFKEVVIFARLLFNDKILSEHKLDPIFFKFLYPYMRLKVSLDRKSRQEFVGINQMSDRTDDILNRMSNISNITGAKK